MNNPKAFKILVVGGDKTNKTSTIKTLINQQINQYRHTTSINIYHTMYNKQSVIYWDVPFSEYRARMNLPFITEETDGVIVLTSKESETSYDAAKDWIDCFSKTQVPILLVSDEKEEDSRKNYNYQRIISECPKELITAFVLKRKEIIEHVNGFLKVIYDTTKHEELKTTTDIGYKPKSTPSIRSTLAPSPHPVVALSPVNNSPAEIKEMVTEEFLNDKIKVLNNLYDDVMKTIEEIRKSTNSDNVFDQYKAKELVRYEKHLTIEREIVTKQFDEMKQCLHSEENCLFL